MTNNSLYRRLFDKPIPCPVCGCGYKWAVDPARGTLYCFNDNINDPKLMCRFEYQKDEVLSRSQIIMFNQMVQISRLFSVH